MDRIKEKLASLPLCPGVYIMKNADGDIIYVGKSKVLKNRVSQYFQNSAAHSAKTRSMVSHISDFEYIITDTEAEALALECNLIKKYRPKYNILLKDDKQYPYVKITAQERFPRIFITRQLKKDGGLYFGPFMTALNVKEAVEEIRRIFKIRSCKKKITESTCGRPCLYYQIGQCSSPCSGKITEKEYKESLSGVSEILGGNYNKLIRLFEEKMQTASKCLEFERAAQYRDKISALKSLAEKQKVSSVKDGDMDFIGIYQEGESFCIQVFYYRGGNAVGSEYFTFKNEKSDPKSLLESFVKQFYFTASDIPKNIYLSDEIEDKEDIEVWLSQNVGHRVTFMIPQRGKKAEIIKMVVKNAQESLYKDRMLISRDAAYQNRMLTQLSEILNLSLFPVRIEAYDISNFSGSSSVGVQIVYENAAPQKSQYRKYNIKTVDGQDDYECMREVIYRRINEAYKEEDLIKEGALDKSKAKFLPLPDLILLDGGKGHVSAIKMLFDTLGEDIPVFGVVKDGSHRTRGITDENGEFLIDKHSELFNFLACMQDEVHRFAITASRKRHENRNIHSDLELIPGVGSVMRKKLLKSFKSVSAIKKASVAELREVVSDKAAKNIYNYLNNKRKNSK